VPSAPSPFWRKAARNILEAAGFISRGTRVTNVAQAEASGSQFHFSKMSDEELARRSQT
jgi:hypothetical protein